MLRWTLAGGSDKNWSGKNSDAAAVAVVPLNTACSEHLFDGKRDTRVGAESPPRRGDMRAMRNRRSFVEETIRLIGVGGRGECGSRDPSQGQPLGTPHSETLRPTPDRTLRVHRGAVDRRIRSTRPPRIR